MPHSLDLEYAERAIPQYEHALELAGAEPVRIGFDKPFRAIQEILNTCAGILLPGSRADVAPEKFGAERLQKTADADARREANDELMLQNAYDSRKPLLGICYGLQSLNVFRGGSLIQDIPDYLPEQLRARVNHSAGRAVEVAHMAKIEERSRLAKILGKHGAFERNRAGNVPLIPVNSSHHQSAESIGNGLRVVARCPQDGIVEALEGTDPQHFVLAVQWHPERSVSLDDNSRAIFEALIEAAKQRQA